MRSPKKNEVNRPVDPEKKEKSINQKLQFYGIFTAFQNGKAPSNEQIDVALNSVLESKPLTSPSDKLSPEGKSLVGDLRQVIEDAKLLLLSKNEGNVFQNFIWQVQQIEARNAGVRFASVNGDTAQQQANEALEGLRSLGTLLVSNGQFRKLLSDAAILLRDMAGDAAENAAGRINPSQDQLSQIDKPAEDNVWHENPSGSDVKSQITSTFNRNKPVSTSDVKDAAGNASGVANGGGANIDAQNAANAASNTLQSRASGNIPDDTKEQARDKKSHAQEKARNYLKGKFPQNRRDQLIFRLKKMVVEIQGHPDYLQAIDTLLYLAEQYAGHANDLGQQSVGSIRGAHEDTALQSAEADLKLLIERFANNTSTQDFFDAINNIYRDADQDPELKGWFKAMDKYVRKCLKQQGFIMEDEANEEWNRLYDQGNLLLRERYRNHTDRIIDEVKFIGDQFSRDPMNNRLGESLATLFTNLGNDSDGKLAFKPHLVKDFSEVIVPAALENFGYIPIPRIEYSDPTMDVVIENLVLESDNFTPNLVEFYTENTFRWGRKGLAAKDKHAIELKVSGVQMDLRNVAYHINRKDSPKILDTGLADIFLGGNGLSFKIKMRTPDKEDRQNIFKIDKVDVDVKNFNIKLVESKHKLLFAIAKPLMLRIMRPALQKIIENIIQEKATELDSFLYQVKLEAERAQRDALKDPENVPNIYNRYVTAFQKKVLEGKQKAAKIQAKAADTRFNIAVTSADSIFPDIRLPGGISNKATEFNDLAKKGDKWETPVFSIGSAAKSTDIPSAGEITRKQHNVTDGGIRGVPNAGNTQSTTGQVRDPAAQQLGNPSRNGKGVESTGVPSNGSGGSTSQNPVVTVTTYSSGDPLN